MPSNVAGYLLPDSSPAPLQDAALENFFQSIVVGILSFNPKLVRPRWQPEPPNQPEGSVDWLALGIVRMDPDTYAATIHDSAGNGKDELQRHETVELLISAYGPNAARNLALFREGIQIEQNRAVLTANAMGLESTGEILAAPALVKDRWVRKFDMRMTVRRQIRHTYQVYNLLSIAGGLQVEGTSLIEESIDVPAPTP